MSAEEFQAAIDKIPADYDWSIWDGPNAQRFCTHMDEDAQDAPPSSANDK